MSSYIWLGITSCFPIVLTVLFLLLEKYTKFCQMKRMPRQVIIGVAFGLVAVIQIICSTKQGIAALNAADAVPLCAGLIFGGPAGLIAGCIGGVFRWAAAFWGIGTFTRWACSIALVLSGLYAVYLRKYILGGKLPSPILAFCIGVVMEGIHNLLYFVTNVKSYEDALSIIKTTSVTVAVSVSLCLTIAIIVAYFMRKTKKTASEEKKKRLSTIQNKIQNNLIIAFVCAFVLTIGFSYVVQYSLSINSATDLLSLNVQDVKSEVKDQSDNNMLQICEKAKSDFVAGMEIYEIKKKYDVSEVNYINEEGIIRMSTNGNFMGYDMSTGEQSKEFLKLLDEGGSMVQEYGPISYDEETCRKYAGAALPTGGFIQVGYDAKQFQEDINSKIKTVANNRHVGNSGYVIVTVGTQVISGPTDYTSYDIDYSDCIEKGDTSNGNIYTAYVGAAKCLAICDSTEGYYIVALMPYSEAFSNLEETITLMSIILTLIFAILFSIVYHYIKRSVLNNLNKVSDSLGQIAEGNLDVVVDVRDNFEFDVLSNDINTTVGTLKGYTEEIRANYEKDMNVAKNIQASVLPNVLPHADIHKEIDLHPFMNTAKEVGGDFFDFYWISHEELLVMVADVSGKGVPAAMFMMRAKTLIREAQEKGATLEEALTNINNQLCDGNDAGMFVTAWIGIINVSTGHVRYANAGHNPPVLKLKGEDFKYLRGRAGFVLAGLENYKYRLQEFDMLPEATLYLYTDGVTEATDSNNQLFGEDRLLKCLNENADRDMHGICDAVMEDIDAFVGDAPQFDDITMLAVRLKDLYKG